VGDERLALVDLDVEGRETGWREPGEAHDFSLKEAARAASREAERQLIMKALTRTQWNRKRAARQLQVSYKSFLYKLKQIGLESSGAESMERRNKCSKDYSCP
jgi:DNA-binding NtrC family response regulator